MNFTFLNIPVRIQPTFWLFLLFFTSFYKDPSIESIIIGCVMTVSLLVHEYGHALTAVYFGAAPRITLEAFGGYAEYKNYGISRKQQLLITLNGPLLESVLIIVPYFLLESDIFYSYPYIEYILYVTMRLNIFWCLLNLIPVDPLDGGHIVRYLLEDRFGEVGYKASLIIGVVSAALIAPYLYLSGFMFFSGFLCILGIKTFLSLRQYRAQTKQSPFSSYMRGLEAVESNNIDDAKKTFKRLLRVKDKHIKHSAIQSLAKIYHLEKKGRKAYKLLLKSDHHLLAEGKGLLCHLAFEQKNYQLVGKYSLDHYSLDPTYETAILNSQAFAYMNQPKLSGGWLVTASGFGIEYNHKVKELLKQATFDSVRTHESFGEAVKRIENP